MTPGVKEGSDQKDADDDRQEHHPKEDETETINAVKTVSVTFSPEPEIYMVRPYALHYGIHPSKFVFKHNGEMRNLKPYEDAATGVPTKDLAQRRRHYCPRTTSRAAILKRVLEHGPAWEETNAARLYRWETTNPSAEKLFAAKKLAKKRVGVKQVKKVHKNVEQHDLLAGEQATLYGALAARANYLSLDRPDLNYATKELCRGFAAPSVRDLKKLKHLGRYLLGRPRLIWQFPFQDQDPDLQKMVTYSDTDFAGCPRTRLSTSGGVVMRGRRCLKAYSQTQRTMSLSSAEAELTGIVKAASTPLGLQSVARDLGFDWCIELRSDASAAIGICRRRGLGKVRHLHVADLWVQGRLRSGDFTLKKWPGATNPADLLTKYLPQADLNKHLDAMNMKDEDGRAGSAPQISKQENNDDRTEILKDNMVGQTHAVREQCRDMKTCETCGMLQLANLLQCQLCEDLMRRTDGARRGRRRLSQGARSLP